MKVRNWGPYLLTYIYMIHDIRPDQMKRSLHQRFGMNVITLEHMSFVWRIFSVELRHNWSRAICPQEVGGEFDPHVSIDETYCRNMLVDKYMAGQVETVNEPCWILLACEVLRKDA